MAILGNITMVLSSFFWNDLPLLPITFITTNSPSFIPTASSTPLRFLLNTLTFILSTLSSLIIYSCAIIGIAAIVFFLISTLQNDKHGKEDPASRGAAVAPKAELANGKVNAATGDLGKEKESVEVGTKMAVVKGSGEVPLAAKADALVVAAHEVSKPVKNVISEKVTSAAVKAAVMLKQSPIPDQLATLTHATLVGYNRVDSAFGIQDRIVNLGQMVVRGGVVASGIAAAAFLRAGVAYHLAPGYKETQNSTSLTPIDAGDGKGSPVVRIVRVDMMPGGMPLPETVEVSTQTDPLLCGAIVPPPNSLQHPDGVPTTTVGTSRSPTLFQSVLHKSATVATVLLASSSNYVFGAETTKKLMGEEETVACGKPCCIGEEGDVSPIRNLVVGGIYYATTLETLRRVPGSRLAKWFSETNKMTMKANGVMAKDGTLFIDRDGTHFRHILNHLRGLPLPPTLTSREVLTSLRYEAVHYDLVGLVVEIDERLTHLDRHDAELSRHRHMELQRASVASFGTTVVASRSCSPSREDTWSVTSDESSGTLGETCGGVGGYPASVGSVRRRKEVREWDEGAFLREVNGVEKWEWKDLAVGGVKVGAVLAVMVAFWVS